jgi:hypothetical protein
MELKKTYRESFNGHKRQRMTYTAGGEFDSYWIHGQNEVVIRVHADRATVVIYRKGKTREIVGVSAVCGEIMDPIKDAMKAQRIADVRFALAQILPQPIAEEVSEYI